MTREQRLRKRQQRRRHRERKQEAAADARPLGGRFGKGESDASRRSRFGAQQLRHDRRRRRGQANRDPGARRGSSWGGFWPAGGERRK